MGAGVPTHQESEGSPKMEKQSGMITKIVSRKGYGFIKEDSGSGSIFFHCSGVCGKFDDLREGMRVVYLTTTSPVVKPQASGTAPAAGEVEMRERAIGVTVSESGKE